MIGQVWYVYCRRDPERMRTRGRYLAMVSVFLWLFVAVPAYAFAQDGVTFTAEQAERGSIVFSASCWGCHGRQLQGGDGPPLVGRDFLIRWSIPTRTLDDLFAQIQVFMPKDLPESLPLESYVDVVAYILEQNGYQVGGTPLTSRSAELRKIRLRAPTPPE